ncbi:CBS domain-containing protein [Rhizomonospora bruguierae]|uniref:CBS domain-containing protein n=1 Tax=Rhizomonospora bruguierae TaxID=1581705 RepID=UPI001BCDE171|nr:CBS domain-containing protein [Micromonospora sp. NBRC 107566]
MPTVREVMTAEPLTMDASDTLVAAAQQMRDAGVGDVIVTMDDQVLGIVTDRDITVRGIAEDLHPESATLDQIVTRGVVGVAADEDVTTATDLMREYSVRRLPVIDNGRLIGIVSIGDLSLVIEDDTDAVLADISADEPNN